MRRHPSKSSMRSVIRRLVERTHGWKERLASMIPLDSADRHGHGETPFNVPRMFGSRSPRLGLSMLEELEGRLVMAQSVLAPVVETAPLTAAAASAPVSVTFTVSSDWQTGFTAQMSIVNYGATAVAGWTLEFDFGYQIDSIWNAKILSKTGSHYKLGDMGYNATIAPSASTSFGFNGSPGGVKTPPSNYLFNGAPLGSPGPLPTVSIQDVSATEGTTSTSSGGFFKTLGNQIVDSNNNAVRIAGVNWFGMETTNYAPHGLWTRSYTSMMDQMKQLGFNTIRLPYSSQLFDSGSTPNGIDFNKNPDLVGLNGLQIMDKIVDYAGKIGLRILLDHHRSAAGNSANESGLWYTSTYTEARWISDWTMLASRYAGNPTVIGADLHNEPHGPATWGDNVASTDWRWAAEKAGNAILAANPNWLILVEGIETTSAGSTWWGGNLSNAGAAPVRLNVPGRLVYSPHEYPASIYPQKWFSDPAYPNNLPAVWDKYWGYLYRQGTAPILIGELGSKLETTSDQQWAAKLIAYIAGDLDGNGSNDLAAGKLGVSWTWWSWNPNSGDTGGILKDDWNSVQQAKVDLLKPVEFALPSASGTSASAKATFNVTLSKSSATAVTINYATADGTAQAGKDYIATTGVLTFQPGETKKAIEVILIGDAIKESNEYFYVRLSSPTGATISDGEGQGTIVDDDASAPPPPPPPPPSISIASVSVIEGGGAVYTLQLSQASTSSITVNYATEDGTAKAGADYQAATGVLTFAPGTLTKTVTVQTIDDLLVEASETFYLNLSNPVNATILSPKTLATITDNDQSTQPVGVEFVVNDDWGAGFVASISITNRTNTTMTGWTLEFDFDAQLTSIWNAKIVSQVGNHYIITNADWNKVIEPGKTVTFGFQGSPGQLQNRRPTGFVVR